MSIESKYQAAIATHAHFDNISIAIVTGMIALTGAAIAISPTASIPHEGTYVAVVAIIIVCILYRIYGKCAQSALIARNVAAALEEQRTHHGVSHVSINIDDEEFGEFRPIAGTALGTGSRTVRFLTIVLCVSLVFVGLIRW